MTIRAHASTELSASELAIAVPHADKSVGGRIVIQAWLASRGLIALVALVLAVVEHRRLGEMVMNWDARHFENLAINGYLGDPDGILMAFFPGLPAVLSIGLSLGIPVALTGVIVSLAASAVAAAALLRLGGPWAAVAWLFAPTAVFTTVPYTESLFCAAAFWAWERARADRWAASALLAAAACTVRVSGLFLLGALAVMVLTSRGLDLPGRTRRLAWLLLPVAVIGAPAEAPGLGPLAAIIALGVVGTGVAFAIFYDLIATVGPARAFIVTYLAPGFAVVYGVTLLDEPFGLGTAAGLILILAGSWMAADGRIPWRRRASRIGPSRSTAPEPVRAR
jgi:drug/metabolite transporter (DMT)-like permease